VRSKLECQLFGKTRLITGRGNNQQCPNDQSSRKGNKVIESIIDITLVSQGEVSNGLAGTMTEFKEDTGSDHKLSAVEWGRKSGDGTNQEVIAGNINQIEQVELKEMKKGWGKWSEKRGVLLEESTIQELEDGEVVITNEITRVQSEKANEVKMCERSMKWWNARIPETGRSWVSCSGNEEQAETTIHPSRGQQRNG
jgi:hypothetical protein